MQVDFFSYFFLLLRGRGVGVNFFFIVERLGRGSPGVIFFTNSLWEGGKGAP